VLAVACTLDHLLKNGPTIVTGRGAGLDEFRDDFVVVGGTPRPQLGLLIGYREIVLSLATC
jgi:hypothetical protein